MFQWKVLVWSRGIRASRGWMEAFSISFSCLWPNQTQTEQSTECAGRWEAANQLLLTHCTDARSCSQKASLNQLEISSCQTWNCLTRNLTYEKQQEWEKVTQRDRLKMLLFSLLLDVLVIWLCWTVCWFIMLVQTEISLQLLDRLPLVPRQWMTLI